MSRLAPPWALGALGLPSAGDPHLVDGAHLRVMPHPALGLPLRPLIVYRQALDEGIWQAMRAEVRWVDQDGLPRTAPFQVRPGEVITGHLPVNAVRRATFAWVITGKKAVPELSRAVFVQPGEPGGLSVTAWASSPAGPVPLGRRDDPPYAFSASEIGGVTVTGDGTVAGLLWLESGALPWHPARWAPWRLLALPVGGGARYDGLPAAFDEAIARVRRGAPARLGWHDAPAAAGPAACPPATPDDEEARLRAIWPELAPHLQRLVDDTSARPQALVTDQAVGAAGTAETGTVGLRPLPLTLAAALDPGIGRLLGLVDVDEAPLVGVPTLYRVRGLFAVDPDGLSLGQILSLLAIDSARLSPTQRPEGLPAAVSVPPDTVDGRPVYDVCVDIVVVPGQAPARPPAPQLAAPADGGAFEAVAPGAAARRRIGLSVGGLVGGGTLGLARTALAGPRAGVVVGLNRKIEVGGRKRAQGLVPSAPPDAPAGGGQVEDRDAGPEALVFRAAQADPFGRWSEVGAAALPAKTRPLPPAPVLEADYTRAAFGSPVPDGPLWGALRARARVPEAATPGALPLAALRLHVDFGGGATALDLPLPAGHPPGQPLIADVLPPAHLGLLGRGAEAKATVRGRWVDAGGVEGPEATLAPVRLVDARPPAPVVIDPTLRLSARPDATGRSALVLDWPAAPGLRYRVFATDETRLLARLQEEGGPGVAALLAELDGVTDAPTRAAIFAGEPHGTSPGVPGRAALYHRGLFEALTDEGVSAPAGGGPVRFLHHLNGGSRVLSFFRVVSLSAQGVESDFAASPFVPVGVPSDGPPPRPLIELVPEDADEEGVIFVGPAISGARLRARVVRGAQPAARFRLLRSSATAEAARMPVAFEGTLVLPPGDGDGPVTVDLFDDGRFVHDAAAKLRPYTRTTWRLQVQAPPPPGSDRPGLWSEPSDALTGMRVPPALTEPPALNAVQIGALVQLRVSHPAALTGGALGSHRVDLYRADPGGRERRVHSLALPADPMPGQTFAWTDPTPPAAGTTWRALVLDPLGRASPPSALRPAP